MAKKLLWIDMEMTGLDDTVHVVLELAAIITDLDFKALGEFHRIVYQPPEKLALMDAWCVKTHGDSGLTAAVAKGAPLESVETDLIAILETHYPADEKIVIAGNSIGNDRRFIDRYMPKLAKRLHYRMVDVSSFKEIFRDKYGIEYKKGDKHRAVDDIFESINELKAYLALVKTP
jgi:oligoribonuclease